MPNRYYSSTATATTLSSGVSGGATTLVVASVTGFPVTFPYMLIIAEGTPSEELVDVTNASGTTLTVTRGVDGTTGVSHSSGATITHGTSGRDFREAQETYDEVFEDWSSYTATWTSSGTAPVIGNGTVTARYKRTGDTVNFQIKLSPGSTTTYGTGTWSFALPTALGTLGAAFSTVAYDASENMPFAAAASANGSGTTLTVAGTGVFAGVTAPFSWQNGDTLLIAGAYEAA